MASEEEQDRHAGRLECAANAKAGDHEPGHEELKHELREIQIESIKFTEKSGELIALVGHSGYDLELISTSVSTMYMETMMPMITWRWRMRPISLNIPTNVKSVCSSLAARASATCVLA